jgi:hypothetical protein
LSPRTMIIVVCETILHDIAEVPDDGIMPNFAKQFKLVVKLDPVSVIVLLAYAAAGLTAVAEGAALMVKDCALLGPSIVAKAAFLVVTAAFNVVLGVPYVTDGIMQRKFVEFGAVAVMTVMTRTPETLMLELLEPSPPLQLVI